MAGSSSNFPNRPFTLYDATTVVRQEVANNRTLVRYSVAIRKNSYSPTSSDGVAYARWGYDGTVINSRDPGGFDFRSSGPWQWVYGEAWVNHTANGTKTINVQVGANFDILGATSYSYNFTLPAIARNPPPAPTGLTLDNITRNSMRYRFQSNGDGGSPIIRFQFQYSTTPGFTTGNSAWITSNGTSTVTGLKPGTRYYFRSQAVNAAGTSPSSNVLNSRTLSGAWISDGTQWLPADVLISDGTQWLPANVDISDGTTWRPSG